MWIWYLCAISLSFCLFYFEKNSVFCCCCLVRMIPASRCCRRKCLNIFTSAVKLQVYIFMSLMLLVTIYCCSVHVFFPTFSLTVVGRCRSRECNDHCFVYNRRCFVIKLANWSVENGPWLRGETGTWFISSITTATEVVQCSNPSRDPPQGSLCIWRKIRKHCQGVCFSCVMVIVNVCKLEYAM